MRLSRATRSPRVLAIFEAWGRDGYVTPKALSKILDVPGGGPEYVA